MDISRRLKRRAFRKAKQQGKLSSEDFKREELEALRDSLKKFYRDFLDMLMKQDSSLKKHPLKFYGYESVQAIETIDLILSEDTDIQPHDWIWKSID